MQYVNLGRSGLKVSRLCLGTMNFGYVTDEAEAFKIMDESVAQGVNFFDSADVYGGPQKPDIEKGFGISEEIIGRWLEKSKKRDSLVIATKCYQPMNYGPNDRRLSAYHIRKACEDSLRRLKTDHIDLYQMHHIDRFTPWEEIWQAMELLVQQGKVIYVGSSNFAGWHIATAQGIADCRHFWGWFPSRAFIILPSAQLNRKLSLPAVITVSEFCRGVLWLAVCLAVCLRETLIPAVPHCRKRRRKSARSSKNLKPYVKNSAKRRQQSLWPGFYTILP